MPRAAKKKGAGATGGAPRPPYGEDAVPRARRCRRRRHHDYKRDRCCGPYLHSASAAAADGVVGNQLQLHQGGQIAQDCFGPRRTCCARVTATVTLAFASYCRGRHWVSGAAASCRRGSTCPSFFCGGRRRPAAGRGAAAAPWRGAEPRSSLRGRRRRPEGRPRHDFGTIEPGDRDCGNLSGSARRRLGLDHLGPGHVRSTTQGGQCSWPCRRGIWRGRRRGSRRDACR
jgi:hypothetical protein